MKIALIGPHGTGKTTIAHEIVVALKKENINVDFLGEIARECPFPINKEVTKKAQEWIIYFQCLREIEAEEKTEILICDRSLFDGYVYYSYFFEDNRVLEELIKEKIKEYSLLIKIPLREGYLINDGIRDTDKKFQSDIEERFNTLLKKLNVPYKDYEDLNSVINMIKEIRETEASNRNRNIQANGRRTI